MKRVVLIMTLVALAGCGADGAPFTPNANLGLNVGSNGVSTTAGVGASNGTVSVGINM